MTAVRADSSGLPSALVDGQAGRLLCDELERQWIQKTDELDSIARYALLPPGKLLRPTMALFCAEAVGGDPSEVLPAALAMEYLHVATLTHDDIIDGDAIRRSRPAVHAAYGVPDAIVTGDHLIFTAFQAITECRSAGVEAVAAAVAALAKAGSDLCRGQILEARLVGDPTAHPSSYLRVAQLKTGALFRAVCQIGALLGGADRERAALLGEYGEHFGVAFQIRDDLIAWTQPVGSTDKPAGSDLANGRPTLPVLLAYHAGGRATRRRITAGLARRSADTNELAAFRALLAHTGALDAARGQAVEYGRQALNRLSIVEESDSAAALATIVQRVIGTPP